MIGNRHMILIELVLVYIGVENFYAILKLKYVYIASLFKFNILIDPVTINNMSD